MRQARTKKGCPNLSGKLRNRMFVILEKGEVDDYTSSPSSEVSFRNASSVVRVPSLLNRYTLRPRFWQSLSNKEESGK